MPAPAGDAELREAVRSRYAAAAVQVSEGGSACCGPAAIEIDENFGAGLYAETQRGTLPAEAVAASLGCGNPTAVADLNEGDRVLDLGSGGGIDALLTVLPPAQGDAGCCGTPAAEQASSCC